MEYRITETNYGKIRGVRAGESIVYMGIPYAKPPVGELRFRAPEKPDPFHGIFEAGHFGNRAAQHPTGDAVVNPFDAFYQKEFYTDDPLYETPVSEDGLYLNIWTPVKWPAEKMPVLFYIHGGGFSGGTGHEREFRTDAYAKRGIILVTINYRLGIFGYMAHPWLYSEDPRACGNYGTLDQLAALDWVRENIAAFGGDPENITICGQSAGGMSVHTLMCVREADGKYRRAIIQSAGGYPNDIVFKGTLDLVFPMGERAAQLAGAGCAADLRGLTAEQLLDIQDTIMQESFAKGMGLPYSPTVNGHLIRDTLNGCMESGQVCAVPTVIGCNRNDITVTPEEIAGPMEGIGLHQSDVSYSLQREELQGNPSYVYFFDHNLPGDDAGSFHSGELWYTFGTLKECWRPMEARDYALSEEMVTRWSCFARTGSPNGEGMEPWEKCTKEHPYVKIFQ